MRKWIETFAAVAVLIVPVRAAAANVTVTDPWVRSLPGNAAGYFTLKNNDDKTVVLTGAMSNACGMVMLHKSSSEGGMASMSDVDSVSLAPQEIVAFAPGGYHLMCMEPKPDIAPGKRVTITLTFGDGSENPVAFAVRNAAGR